MIRIKEKGLETFPLCLQIRSKSQFKALHRTEVTQFLTAHRSVYECFNSIQNASFVSFATEISLFLEQYQVFECLDEIDLSQL